MSACTNHVSEYKPALIVAALSPRTNVYMLNISVGLNLRDDWLVRINGLVVLVSVSLNF